MSHKGSAKLFPCDGLPLPGIKPPEIYGHTGSARSWIRPSAVANLLQKTRARERWRQGRRSFFLVYPVLVYLADMFIGW